MDPRWPTFFHKVPQHEMHQRALLWAVGRGSSWGRIMLLSDHRGRGLGTGGEAPFIELAPDALPEFGVPLVLARFQLARFHTGLFAQESIACPERVRNSVVKRQAEFIAGRLCARSILAAHGLPDVAIAIGAHREPVWPPSLIGSITHNGQYAAAIACPPGPFVGIGIDIESVIKDDARQSLVDMVVSAQEADYLRASTGGLSFNCLLTLVFSAKESFFKAAFAQVQEYFDFDAVSIVDIDAEQRIMRFRCEQTLSKHLARGYCYDARFAILDSASIFTVVLLKNPLPSMWVQVPEIALGAGLQRAVNVDSRILSIKHF